MMDPQDFIRLSIGSLGLRIPVKATTHASSPQFNCKIKLRGFPVQTARVPLISSSEPNPDSNTNPIVFYLEESDIRSKSSATSGCFKNNQPFFEITVYIGKRKKIGVFRIEAGPDWGEGKPSLIHNGWVGIGKKKEEEGRLGEELHLRVKIDPDPRYVFEFQDETISSPQIVQVQGNVRQPIFSCKFSRDRRSSQLDPIGTYWSNLNADDQNIYQERKGWKIMIHDLSGSAVAAAFMATPFVPSTNSSIVARSNPGSWLIARPDPVPASASWHPWGRLEAYRQSSGARDSICLRLFLLPDGQEAGVLVSDELISTDKGGEFCIDMVDSEPAEVGGGFVMSCRVKGERKRRSKPLVHLAMRHVSCVEDAAIFMALGAAVDLSIEACKPFRRKMKKEVKNSLLS